MEFTSNQPLVNDAVVDPYLLPWPIDPPVVILTEAQELLQRRRDFLTKCKVVVLHQMHKNPMASYTQLNKMEQCEFKRLVEIMYETAQDVEVIRQFNNIVCGVVLDEKVDPSIYSVFIP